MKHIKLFKQKKEMPYDFTSMTSLNTKQTVLSTKQGDIVIWSHDENKMKQLISGPKKMPIAKMLALSSEQLACAYADGEITVFNIMQKQPGIGLLSHQGADVNIMIKLKAGLLTIDSLHRLCIWEIPSFDCQLTLDIKKILLESDSNKLYFMLQTMNAWPGMQSVTTFLFSYLSNTTIDNITAAVALPNDEIALGTSNGKIIILNQQGELLHTLKTTQFDSIDTLPQVNQLLVRGQKELISVNEHGHVDAWNIETRKKAWSNPCYSNKILPIFYITLLNEETALCAVTSQGLQCFDLVTGNFIEMQQKWREKEMLIQALSNEKELVVMASDQNQSKIYSLSILDLSQKLQQENNNARNTDQAFRRH
jgi:hypothetical protein